MLCLAQDVGAVVDAVEVDGLAVVVLHFASGRRRDARHRRQRRPAVDVRHHFAILYARRDVSGPPHDGRNAPAAFKGRSLLAAERGGSGIGIGIEPGAVVGGQDDDGVGRIGTNRIHYLADVGVHFHEGIRVVAEVRLASELGRRIGRVVHLDPVHVHEERLAALRVLLDVGDGVVGLPFVHRRHVVVGDRADPLGGLTGHSFPLAQVHDGVVHLFEFRVVRREPGMEPLGGVRVGIDAGVIGGELLHLIEAMLGWIGRRLVAQVPLAGEVRGVTVLLEEFGDRRGLRAEVVLVARSNHDR